jgi:hypothetical protein
MRRRQPGSERDDLDRDLTERFRPRSPGRAAPGATPIVVPELEDVCFVPAGKDIDQALYFVAVCRGPRRGKRAGSAADGEGESGRGDMPPEPDPAVRAVARGASRRRSEENTITSRRYKE